MEYETTRGSLVSRFVVRFANRKPCSVCGAELGESFAIEKSPFSLTLIRYCEECK